MAEAVQVATAVLEAKKQEVKALHLIPVSRGRFEVKRDGEMIYNNEGDLPDPEAVLQKLGIPAKA
ncbi:MAG: hypothetical protein D6736_09115 [Nitrospinota bacterium]|nr:MAG: hypothetical protein D6736_09115 [Nitrospinota bacterium]